MLGVTIESSSFASSRQSRLNNSSLNQSTLSNSNNTPRGGKIVPNSITREVNSPIRNNKTSPIRSSSSSNSGKSSTSPIRNNNKWATTKKGQSSANLWSDGQVLDPETRRRSISEEIITLRDDNSKLRREMDNMKLLLNCQKEENFILSTSLFSAQEELKKLKTIIKKREADIREQQEKMESLLSHSVDMRPRRDVTKSPNSDVQVLKKELELLRAKLKASDEKFDKLKMINKETEDNIECLISQLEHERVTKDQLLDQAKNSLLSSQFEKEKNDSFKLFLDLYQDNNKHVGKVDLEDKYEQLLLAKQDLETKLFKREEQLIEMTMRFESARSELIKSSIM